MAAPTTAACVKKTLANPEPSTHGPSRRWRSAELAAGSFGWSCRHCRHQGRAGPVLPPVLSAGVKAPWASGRGPVGLLVPIAAGPPTQIEDGTAKALRCASRRHLALWALPRTQRLTFPRHDAPYQRVTHTPPRPAQSRLTTIDQPADRTRTPIGISVRPARGPRCRSFDLGASCSVA
jgi:hypothetical protein